jgi:Pentapeptide repeats (8 copies)
LKANNAKFSGPDDPNLYCSAANVRSLKRPAELDRVLFVNVSLTDADFRGTHLVGTSFENSDLTNASFKCALLRYPKFDKTIVTGAEFSEDFGAHDYATAQTLKKEGAQISVPDKPPRSLSLTSSCNDADCEYQRASERISDLGLMPDLAESLILKGGRQNWEAAAVGLTEMKSSPRFVTNVRLQGEYLLLTLLLRLVSGQPDHEAMHDWCSWITKNRKLDGWDWWIWDNDVHRRHLSREVLAKITLVEASAQGKGADQLCTKLPNK